MKTNIIPFDLETAKKIQAGEIEGKIVTKNGEHIRVLALNIKDMQPIAVAVTRPNGQEVVYTCYPSGKYLEDYNNIAYDLVIELPEEAPKHEFKVGDYVQYGEGKFFKEKHEFKPFDKVLVRDNPTQEWVCTLLSSVKDDGDYPIYLSICNYPWIECIPYEGNEHLVGTTNNPE